MKEMFSVTDSLNSHFGEEYMFWGFFDSMIALFVLIRTCYLNDKIIIWQ